jgi:predicted SnoaL-like aldol condensation-catalyzing enzyme
MLFNPYDPWQRTDLSPREALVLRFTDEVLHGDNMALVDEVVSPDYRQHTDGIGQGRQGLRNYLEQIAWRRAGRRTWRPIHLFESGDFVILHKLLPAVVIADFFRFDQDGMLAEHWDVVQPLPTPDYDPMRLSQEDFTRFYALFGIPSSTP